MGIDGAVFRAKCLHALFVQCSLGGGVTGDHQVVKKDSRTCPAEIIHLNCMGDGESGLSACVSHQGKTNHFS